MAEEQCENPAHFTVELWCACQDKSHKVWLCADHYDFWMTVVNMGKETFGAAEMIMKEGMRWEAKTTKENR